MIYPLVISYIAIEDGHRKFVTFPMKNGGSFYSCICLQESAHHAGLSILTNCLTWADLWDSAPKDV